MERQALVVSCFIGSSPAPTYLRPAQAQRCCGTYSASAWTSGFFSLVTKDLHLCDSKPDQARVPGAWYQVQGTGHRVPGGLEKMTQAALVGWSVNMPPTHPTPKGTCLDVRGDKHGKGLEKGQGCMRITTYTNNTAPKHVPKGQRQGSAGPRSNGERLQRLGLTERWWD